MLGDLIRDRGREGRRGYTLPRLDVEETNLDEILPEKARRKERPKLPEVDEPTSSVTTPTSPATSGA